MKKLDKIDRHPSHPRHSLYYKRIKTLCKCNGCDQVVFGLCYRCKESSCNFYLHEECARPTSDTQLPHPFYPKHIFLFRDHKPRRVRSCEACGNDVSGVRYKGWHKKAYQSSNPFWWIYQHFNQKALHPCCAHLPSSLPGDDGLVLKLNKNKKSTKACMICNNAMFSRSVKGWAYISSCGKFSYHVACVKREMEAAWERESLNKSQRRRRMAIKILEEVAKSALELIIDAILGYPPKELLSFIMRLLFSGED